ncbi:hypothetical protein [Amycolatopsis alkalitolerans]|uniref:PH domain-containing protein n=1 Tax=Amycolatopsis alkalitolerans TaxID=2547244 RepID=A0A5C4M5N3_9PSEU|nr:hypothetical protein [Amycolatopsis alkalitolerans]TNC28472.1 hypothetical protein FG385_04110 [Amycolatopsis alkalitolerans]
MTRIRLGWEAQIDKVTYATAFLIVGLALVILGSVLGWAVWLAVPVIVVGVVSLLVFALRMRGWRSLWWRRELVIGADGIAYEAKNSGFTVAWSDLAVLGVHSDNGVIERFGLTLVFFPRSVDFTQRLSSFRILRLPRNGAFKVRIPRRAGIVEAINGAAPAGWQRVPSPAWNALVVEPGVDPHAVPVPDPRPPVVVNVGRKSRRQALIGGVLMVAAAAAFLAAIFGNHNGGVTVRVIASVLGAPFIIGAVAMVLSGPMVARSRYVVIDADSFTWDDPSGQPFTFAWNEIASVAVQTRVSRSAPGTWASQRRIDSILVSARQEHRKLPVGDQRAEVDQIGRAVQQFAPRAWAGATTGIAGPLQLS